MEGVTGAEAGEGSRGQIMMGAMVRSLGSYYSVGKGKPYKVLNRLL